ncbi:TetR family transcriptional regulator [Desmonostoc muscorum LEGE 12446]|nr:TetR family transcriptional regulator [Desmonostoc muscorum LEGE 12446]
MGRKTNSREQLLAAARTVLAEKGYEATSISEIVARAGVTQAAFYLYFPSKSSLITTLTEEMFGKVQASLTQVTQGLTELDAILEASVRAIFPIIEQYSDIMPLIHSGAALIETVDTRENLFAPFKNWMYNLLNQAIADGQVSPGLNSILAANYVVHLLERAGEDAFIYQKDIPLEIHICSVLCFIRQALGTHKGRINI